MDWLAFALLFALAVAILLLPGWLLGYAIGLRGSLALLCAAPLTLGLVAVLSVALASLPVPWTPLNFALGALAAAAVVYLGWWLRWLSSGHSPNLRIMNLNPVGLIAGIAVAAAMLFATTITVFGSPDHFAQTGVQLFDLNAVRNSLESQQPVMFNLVQHNASAQSPPFYPVAWQEYVGLVISTAHLVNPSISIAAAANASALAVMLFAWSLGSLGLAQVVGGRSLKVSLPAAVLTSSLYLFPWAYLGSGRYSELASYASLTSALALMMLLPRLRSATPPLRALGRLSRLGRGAGSAKTHPVQPQRSQPPTDPNKLFLFGAHPRTILVLVLLGYLLSAVATHPPAASALGLAVLVALWGAYLAGLLRPASWGGVILRVLGGLILLLISALFAWGWVMVAASVTKPAPGLTTPGAEALNLALSTPAGTLGTTAFTVLLGIGMAAALWQRRLLALAYLVIFSAWYVLAVGGPWPEAARVLGSLVEFDATQLATFWLIFSLPLLLTGLGGISAAVDLLVGKLRSGSPALAQATGATARISWVGVAVTGIVIAAIGLPQQLFSMWPQLRSAQQEILPSATAPYLSADEFALLSRLSQVIPPPAKLIGVPGNGSAFAYALSGVPVVFSGLSGPDSVSATQLRHSMFDRAQLPATCAAMSQLNAHYFADFGASTQAGDYPGLAAVDPSLMQLVSSQGEAKIYRFTGCSQ